MLILHFIRFRFTDGPLGLQPMMHSVSSPSGASSKEFPVQFSAESLEGLFWHIPACGRGNTPRIPFPKQHKTKRTVRTLFASHSLGLKLLFSPLVIAFELLLSPLVIGFVLPSMSIQSRHLQQTKRCRELCFRIKNGKRTHVEIKFKGPGLLRGSSPQIVGVTGTNGYTGAVFLPNTGCIQG